MALNRLQQIAALTKAGLSPTEMDDFNTAGRANPKVADLLKSISDDKGLKSETEQNLLSAMAKKWKSDPALFTKMEKDLNANAKLGEAISTSVKTNPNQAISAVEKYKGGNLPTLLGMPAEPVAAAPAAVKAKQEPQRPAAPASAPVAVAAAPAPAKQKPAAPAAGAASSQIPDAASLGADEEILVVRRDKLSGGPDTGGPKKETAAPAAPKDNGSAEVLQSFAEGSNEDISAAMSPAITAQMLHGLADKAESIGASKATVDGFRKAVQDTALQQRIATNLQKNPDFVRSMAKMAQDKTPMNAIMKPTVLQEMNKFMANPELLADDAHIKSLQKQMKAGQALQDQIGQYLGQFKSGMNDIMAMISGFTGQHSVLSMSRGSGIMPNFLINLHNMGRNQDEARAFANYSPSEMTALTKMKDGSFFHTVMKKDAQGNDVEVKVPNGQITVKTADGKSVDVIPSVGALMAKQEKGSLDENGNFVPGRIKVPVVTSIDKYGVSSGLKNIYMTETEFAKYKAQADALGAEKGGTYSQLAFQNYTAQDLAEAQQKAFKVNVANVDKTTGEVFHVTAQPNLLRPNAPSAEPVRQVAGANPANPANERDFTMQG